MTIKRNAPPPRGGRPKATNPKRRNRNWIRSFESPERVRWVGTLPCVIVGCLYPDKRQNCHTGRGGGMGYRGPSTEIFPCCPTHHRELHQHGPGWFLSQYGVSMKMLYDAAEATEVLWRSIGGEYAE